jgi:hypothetical protein
MEMVSLLAVFMKIIDDMELLARKAEIRARPLVISIGNEAIK